MISIRYIVDDVPAAARFYVTQLGFSEVENFGEAFARLEREGVQLWVAGPKSSAARPMPDGAQPKPGGWNRLVIEVAKIEEIIAALEKSGARFRNTVVRGPGGAQVLVEDPSGNVIELFEPKAG